MDHGLSPGSALVIALLLTFILSSLGLSFLIMAQTESRIAVNEKNALQAFYLAESGSRLVQSWFDRPGGAIGFPQPAVARRSLREVLDERDPYSGIGTPGTQYKRHALDSTDVDLDADGIVDLLRPPYRGGLELEHAFMGLEAAPDLRIDDADTDFAVRNYLDDLSRMLLGPSYGLPGRRERISRIDLFAPPYVLVAGSWTRYGVVSASVTARVYRLDPTGKVSDVQAERTVKTVLNEIPYGRTVFGPIHACGDLQFSGTLSAHWGPVTTAGRLLGYDLASPNIPLSLPRDRPPGPRLDRLWADAPIEADCVREYTSRADGEVVGDPWLRVVAKQAIEGTPALDQPYPSGPADPYPQGAGCVPSATDALECCDRSNLFQFHPLVLCPDYDYDFWKNVARSGKSDVHYYLPDGGSGRFREDGVGASMSFADATNGRTGLFFFDTTDGLAPHDDNRDGVPDNLVEAIPVFGGWQASGFIYLNAEELLISGPLTPPKNETLRAPGEPFLDANGNGRFDSGEAWVNLAYPAIAPGSFRVDATEDTTDSGGTSGSGPVRNSASPHTYQLAVSFSGILYTSGDITARGSGTFYGSLIAAGTITLGGSGGSPDFYWDHRISHQWPAPDQVGLPRVTATRWDEEP